MDIWDELLPLLDYLGKNNKDYTIGKIPYKTVREGVPKLISAISEGSERIKNIVANLKEFARQDVSGMNQRINISEVIHSSVALTKNRIFKTTNNFEVKCDENLPTVRGNMQRLEQVVVNLIINACDALRDSRKYLSVKVVQNSIDNTLCIKVTDEGDGMTEENLQNIRKPFFTTKRKSGGTGLGLAISDKIIQEHGGSLLFESFPGQGTIATIVLPIASDDIE